MQKEQGRREREQKQKEKEAAQAKEKAEAARKREEEEAAKRAAEELFAKEHPEEAATMAEEETTGEQEVVPVAQKVALVVMEMAVAETVEGTLAVASTEAVAVVPEAVGVMEVVMEDLVDARGVVEKEQGQLLEPV